MEWGVDTYAIDITVDVQTFVTLRKRGVVEEVCNQIAVAFNDSLRNTPDSVREVSLPPSSVMPFDERKIAEPSSYWKVDYFKPSNRRARTHSRLQKACLMLLWTMTNHGQNIHIY